MRKTFALAALALAGFFAGVWAILMALLLQITETVDPQGYRILTPEEAATIGSEAEYTDSLRAPVRAQRKPTSV